MKIDYKDLVPPALKKEFVDKLVKLIDDYLRTEVILKEEEIESVRSYGDNPRTRTFLTYTLKFDNFEIDIKGSMYDDNREIQFLSMQFFETERRMFSLQRVLSQNKRGSYITDYHRFNPETHVMYPLHLSAEKLLRECVAMKPVTLSLLEAEENATISKLLKLVFKDGK